MGRDWYWGGGSGSTKRAKSGGGGGGEREIGTTTTTSTTPSGCMSAVFQFFDFHHFQLCLNQHQPPFKPHPFLPDDPIVVLKAKGVEAPRNSLETDQEEAFMADNNTSLSAAIEKEENLTMPMGIQIKTSSNGSSSAESSFSPGAKTPNLVARLMGLDILPDCHSPASLISSFHGRQGNPNSLNKHHMNHQSQTTSRRNYTENDVISTRSLPETPRISSARRSDVEHHHHHHHHYHHRLSLQINKDQIANINDQDLELYSNYSSMAKRKDFKLVTNNDYARQIVKQVKESVGRRVGLLDITNTLVKNNNRSSEEMMIRKDEHLMKIKSKIRSSTKSDGHDLMISQNKSTSTTPTSSSPRLRFFQAKDQTVCGQPPKPPSSPSPLPLSSSSLSSLVDNQSNSGKVLQKPKIHQQKQEQKSVEKISSRSKKVIDNSNKTNRKKREEPFVCPATALRANNSERKSKKTLLSNELGPNLLPVKKDPSPPATKLLQKQVPCAQASKRGSQLSSSSSQLTTYKQETTQPPIARENIAPAATAISGGGAEILPYVTKILKHTGIDRDTLVSFTRWFSPSHPLDPSIFTHLEPTFFTTTTAAAASDPFGQLRHRGNRRLIFHLVDEILVDILKPYLNMKPWARCGPTLQDQNIKGSELIEKLCEKIGTFPSANCEVLEDIDALIDADLKERTMSFSSVAFEEEGEAIVLDIEKDMVDSVVQEMVLLCGGFW